MLSVVNADGTTSNGSLIDEIVREGVRRMLAAALEAKSTLLTRLTAQWQADHAAFMDRDLSGADYVYMWADGIHLNVRLEEARACVLVLIGVRADGSKELVALQDGYRESGESWADLLRDCTRRGMRAPVLAVGDGALGFWKALTEVFPDTRAQRCWVQHAQTAIKTFAQFYGAKYPKVVRKVTDDQEHLLAFFDFPAEYWIHLRTTNPIEWTFATVRLRTKVTKGAGSRTAALAMVFKLIESAQDR